MPVVETETHSVKPLGVSGSFGFNTEDLEKAFSGPEPDEELFFDLFFNWPDLKSSERLHTLARVAELCEADDPAVDPASTVTNEKKGIPA